MVLKVIWRKTRIYRRFELDIWGRRILQTLGHTKLGKLFNTWDSERMQFRRQKKTRYVYRIDLDQPNRGFKRQKWWFVTRRVSRLFYLTLSHAQFKKLSRVAAKKEGSWESNFIMLIENRVLGMLYRMQINLNIFELRWIVLTGKVLVNNVKVTYYNAAVKYFDILRLNSRISDVMRSEVIDKFKAGALYFNVPRYMFVSYKHMFAFVYKEPKRVDLAFPTKAVDVYRSADYC